jgi:hypothetical protein
MQAIDVLGYAASALVFLTFYMKEMAALRAAALCSNVCFLAYGLSLKLGPVVALHAALIPINLWRLAQALSCGADFRWLARQRLQLLMRRVTRLR